MDSGTVFLYLYYSYSSVEQRLGILEKLQVFILISSYVQEFLFLICILSPFWSEGMCPGLWRASQKEHKNQISGNILNVLTQVRAQEEREKATAFIEFANSPQGKKFCEQTVYF